MEVQFTMMKLCLLDSNKKNNSKEKGSALIIIIAVIAMLTVLAISIASLSVSYYKITGRLDRTERAEYLAQSGTDKAVALLKNSGGSVDSSINKYIDSSMTSEDMMNIDVSGEPDVSSPTKIALFKADNGASDKTSCAAYVNMSDGGKDILVTSKAAVPYNNTHLYKTVQLKINKDKSFGANSSNAYMNDLFQTAFTVIDNKNLANQSFTCGDNTTFNVQDSMTLQGGIIDIFPQYLTLGDGSQKIKINACKFRLGYGTGGSMGTNSLFNFLTSVITGTFSGFNPTIYYRCTASSEYKLQNLSNWTIGGGSNIISDDGTNVKDYELLDVRKENTINLYNADIPYNKLYFVFTKDSVNYAVAYDDQKCADYFASSDYQYTGVTIYRTTSSDIKSTGFNTLYNNLTNNAASSISHYFRQFIWLDPLNLNSKIVNYVQQMYKAGTYFLVFADGDVPINSGTYKNILLYSNGKVTIPDSNTVTFLGQSSNIGGWLQQIGADIINAFFVHDPILNNVSNYGGACICAKQFYLGNHASYSMNGFKFVPEVAKDVVRNCTSTANIKIIIDDYNTH